MAITTDWLTSTFFVPQSDLTFVSGTLYDMDTEVDFRQKVNAIMASEEGIVFDDPIDHNTQYTVTGVTYARKIEVINGYNVTFTPDSQWTVRLNGSNNNIFDVGGGVLNQNQVQVIPSNSAGLIVVTTGSGLDAAQDTKLTEVHGELRSIENSKHHSWFMRIILAALANKLAGADTTNVTIRDQADAKNRIDATVDSVGNRTSVTLDGD